MKHRSTTPGVIVAMAFVAMCFLAILVGKMGSKPIVQLKPELEKQFNTRGFKCWLKLEEQSIEVRAPESFPRDRMSRRKVAAAALRKYLDLTKHQTVVTRAILLPPEGAMLPSEEVTMALDETFAAVQSAAAEVARAASVAAGGSASVVDIAPGPTGAAVFLKLDANLGNHGAQRVVDQVLKNGAITYVQLTRPFGGPYEGGPDSAVIGSATPAAFR